MQKGKVIFIDSIHPILADRLSAAGFECSFQTKTSFEDLVPHLFDAIGIVIRSRFTVDKEFLKHCPGLQFIARSGSGLENIDKVIDIDQSPIGRTPRSNPATYTGVLADIRKIFSEVPEAKIRAYKAGRFSFNVKGGRCEACQGDGMIKVEMHFLADVYVKCDVCDFKKSSKYAITARDWTDVSKFYGCF